MHDGDAWKSMAMSVIVTSPRGAAFALPLAIVIMLCRQVDICPALAPVFHVRDSLFRKATVCHGCMSG